MTITLPVQAASVDSDAIAEAVAVLRRGGLVAFPTETVYGLGANALDPAAVARIFAAKGRSPTNPVIVHIADARQVPLVADLEALTQPRSLGFATELAARFWPGPLTLVLPKTAAVPDIVTAGGPTVAVRVPAHPVALALLRAAGVPLAAPSANRSTELSPTTAGHVLRSLDGRIDVILDAGPTTGGIESTVLDLMTNPARLLRPGLVTPAEIEAVIGKIQTLSQEAADTGSPARSPGLMQKHYAPRAPLELADGDGPARVEALTRDGRRVGWLSRPGKGDIAEVVRIEMPTEPPTYAAKLYAALHELDAAGVDRIVVDRPPDGEEWMAIHDRLRRAESV